jgi:hypothetical protein
MLVLDAGVLSMVECCDRDVVPMVKWEAPHQRCR